MVLQILLLITSVLVALAAGLFYSYSISVFPGLGRLADRKYLHSLPSIIRAILTPLFFARSLGSFIAIPDSSSILFRTLGAYHAFYLLLCAPTLFSLCFFMFP